MNSEKLIHSGILEQYVLGDLPLAEMERLEKRIAQDELLRQEVPRIEESLENLAHFTALAAPKELKMRVLSEISTSSKKTNATFHLTFWHFSTAAAVLFCAVLGYFLIDKNTEIEGYQREISSLNADKTVLADNLNKASFENTVLLEKGTRIISISGENASARVVWNTFSGQTLFVSDVLPAINENNDYQLWAISGDQKIDLGVFHDAAEPIRTGQIYNVDAFAVTIEPKGGSVSPTLEKLILVGAVQP